MQLKPLIIAVLTGVAAIVVYELAVKKLLKIDSYEFQ